MKQLVRYTCWVVLVAAVSSHGQAATLAQQYQALLKESQTNAPNYFQSTNDAERQAIVARVDKVTVSLLELLEKNPKEPFALEGLTQVVTLEYWLNMYTSHPGWGKDSPQARAIALLRRDHLRSDQLIETCKRVNFGFRQECETFLRAVLEENPHRDVRAAACLRLAQLLAGRVEKLDLLKDQPQLARRYEGLFGKEYLEALRKRDRAQVMKEAEALYEQAIEKYSDVKMPYNETVGNAAGTDLFEIRNLAVGKVLADIGGADQDGRPFKLSDYRGQVVLLYFWSEY